MRKVVAKLFVAAGVIIIGIIVTLYFSAKSSRIELVFPDGFRGLAKLRSKQANGIELHKEGGAYIVLFPNSGTLEIKGKLPTTQWHILSARFANGQTIPVVQPDSQVQNDQIALRQAGLDENKEDWFVVGTYDDLVAVQEKKWGFKYPSNQ